MKWNYYVNWNFFTGECDRKIAQSQRRLERPTGEDNEATKLVI